MARAAVNVGEHEEEFAVRGTIGPFAASLIFCLTCLSGSVGSQEVDQRHGVDPQVDYRSLKALGPWDDRNYLLTVEHLELLAPNESELVVPIPAFFRVLLRKNNPDLPKEGPAQYPRSALQIFLRSCGGYLIDGKLYARAVVEDGRYVVVQEDGIEYEGPDPLAGEGQAPELSDLCRTQDG